MGWWLRAGVGALVVAWAAGCSLFIGTDGLTGGSENTPSADAMADDVTPADAGSRPDGDATDGASDASFCQTQTPAHLFCSDFDEPEAAANDWGAFQLQGGTAALDDAVAHSLPYSLLVSSPVKDDSGRNAFVKKSFERTDWNEAILAFDIRPDVDAYVWAGAIQLSGGYSIAIITANQAKEDVPDAGNGGFIVLPSGIPSGVWTRVIIDLRLPRAALGGSVTIRYGEGTQPVLANHPVTDPSASGAPTIAVGMLDTVDPWSGRIDNVTFDLE